MTNVNEIWRPVVGFEGYYEVSNQGNVRSVERYVNAKLGSKKLLAGLVLKKCIDKYGYDRVCLSVKQKRKYCQVHRLVMLAFAGEIVGKKEVNHKNGIKTDNRLENLEWVTTSENQKHAFRTGLSKPVNEKKVAKICKITGQVLSVYKSTTEAARKTGTLQSKISLVCNNKRKSTNGYIWRFA